MKCIRKNVFETNSSSTHSIVISKEMGGMKCYNDLGDYNFGREECRLVEHFDEKLAYIYYIVKTFNSEYKVTDGKYTTIVDEKVVNEFKDRTSKIYNKWIGLIEDTYISSDFTFSDFFKTLDALYDKYELYVDHIEDFKDNDFIQRISTDDNFYARFLFGCDSYITVGGDEYRGYNIKTIGFEYDYDEHYYINEKGEPMPKYDFKNIDNEEWNRLCQEYYIDAGGFWDKLKEYEKTHDVYLKGN